MSSITSDYYAGRPLKFGSPDEMQKKIDEYFDSVPPNECTIFGICRVLDMDYETFMRYERRDSFCGTVKAAKRRVAESYETDLRKKGRSGDIFALKQFGWSDMQRIEHTGANGQPLFLPMQVVGRYDLEQPIYEAEIVPESNGLQKPKTNVLDRLIARVAENVPDEG